MKVIAENRIGITSASNEASGYPKENLLDTYPGFLWKGTDEDETINFYIQNGSSGFALFNTNATTATIQVEAPIAGVLSITEVEDLNGTYGNIFASWDYTDENVAISCRLQHATDDIYAGVAVGGTIEEFNDPLYSFTESTKDLSIVSEYNAGGVYVKDRDILRVFDIEQIMDRTTDYETFITNVKKEIKSNPAAWLLVDGADTWWVVYARITKEPTGKHFFPNDTIITYQLTEVR